MARTNVIQQEFTHNFPLKVKKVRDLKLVTETIGLLVATGILYLDTSAGLFDDDRLTCHLDTITWNGVDVKELLEVTSDFTVDNVVESILANEAWRFEKE